jgi:hypothetical protein
MIWPYFLIGRTEQVNSVKNIKVYLLLLFSDRKFAFSKSDIISI